MPRDHSSASIPPGLAMEPVLQLLRVQTDWGGPQQGLAWTVQFSRQHEEHPPMRYTNLLGAGCHQEGRKEYLGSGRQSQENLDIGTHRIDCSTTKIFSGMWPSHLLHSVCESSSDFRQGIYEFSELVIQNLESPQCDVIIPTLTCPCPCSSRSIALHC